MILLGQYDSPFTRRVAITMLHYGLPFERDTRSVFGDAAAVAAISPLTRIPALLLADGEVLIDSGAIVDYLDELVGPARALMPAQGPARRRILQDTVLAQSTGEKVGVVVYERFFHPPAAVAQDWLARCLGQIAAGLTEMERRCQAPWFCGDDFSQADVMAVCSIGYLRLRLPEMFPDGQYPNLERLEQRCEALPVFQQARIGADEKMPDRT